MKVRPWLLVCIVAIGAGSIATFRAFHRTVKAKTPNANLLFNGWGISPVGNHTKIGDMAFKLVASPDGKEILTTTLGFGGVHLLTFQTDGLRPIQDLKLDRVWNGIAFSPDGKTLYVGGGNAGTLTAYNYAAGTLSNPHSLQMANSFISGIAVSPVNGAIYVCDEASGLVRMVDPGTLTVVEKINVGSNPHSCVFGPDKLHLYVSNWGGESVSVIDTVRAEQIRTVRVGVRPNDMALAPDGRLFVACAGDNTVHVIQTIAPEKASNAGTPKAAPTEVVREIINTSIEPTILEGSTPVGVSVSSDGKTLFVANADNNDVMVADITNPATTTVRGFIPTGWYPTSVLALNGRVYTTIGKGLMSRPNFPAKKPEPELGRQKQPFDYTGNCFEGYLTEIPAFNAETLASWTQKVWDNTPFRLANIRQTAEHSDSIVPDTVGQPSPITHVLYVIMENRTYDQVFGDMKEGNGDPYLCMYGEKVTPNRHKLAREYTLLDNIYCNSEVSVDGHMWCDAAIATDADQREWTSSYSDHGDITNSDEVMEPNGGFLWDSARRAGLTVKAYGEGDNEYLGHHALPRDCRGTWNGRRDMDRVDGWIKDLHTGEKTGKWANFMIMSLGEDHTAGTTPNAFTPEAAVGSNDQAIGKIIAAASKSKFWNSTAIFFVEDDAQNGPDHVDCHRTFGMVVSPYVKRHSVDHTMYGQVSMIRTIELLLGLPPMTQYDAAATPMFNVFSRRPSDSVYALAPAKTDLLAKNTSKSPGAAQSLLMDFDEYDKAPADKLNAILWAEAKGPKTPYPAARTAFGR